MLAGPEQFEVVPLRAGALPGASPDAAVAFWKRLGKLQRAVSAAGNTINGLDSRLGSMKVALERSLANPGALDDEWQAIRTEVYQVEELLRGNTVQNRGFGATPESIQSRMGKVSIGVGASTYGPTQTHKDVIGYAEADFAEVRERLNKLMKETLPAFEKKLLDADAPWTPGAEIPAL